MNIRNIYFTVFLLTTSGRFGDANAQVGKDSSDLATISKVSSILSNSPVTRETLRSCAGTVKTQHERELAVLRILANEATTQQERQDRLAAVQAYATVPTNFFQALCSYMVAEALESDFGTSTAPGPLGAAQHLIQVVEAEQITEAGYRQLSYRLNEVTQKAKAVGKDVYFASVLPIWNSWFVGDLDSEDGLSPVTFDSRLLPGQSAPKYPKSLIRTGVTGSVHVEFVITKSGIADIRTVRVVSSPHQLLSLSVREALLRLRFSPAEFRGQPVRNRVKQAFGFSIP